MSKHTQAHMSRSIPKSQSEFLKQRTLKQMEYYMGAKLIEVGIDPKVALYRWSTQDKGSSEEWTYSAYWGESRAEIEQAE
ncbi:MAG: hypothetical protein HC886_16310 [Leptolyngbyaceae cyanobacterium SM1_1_3]|nr:hypothetical protein [Leptolyngbyaceae cyanobacterium SM1_1_3]NJN04035.1 hypothetical protein [Leptolyngbyaceae cyanobacterium RM1_1_2]NJO09781.1 hypothetical protein [Leptolyngbyaceae cyanobacterium SL_1_1]